MYKNDDKETKYFYRKAEKEEKKKEKTADFSYQKQICIIDERKK